MNTASKLSLAVVALLAVGVSSAQAQTDNISANAVVLTPLTVNGTADLDFGNVYPGVDATIAPTAGTAGTFTIGGLISAQVSMTFVLPTNLANGGDNLPIDTYTGVYNTTNSSAGTGFTPSASATVANLDASTGDLYLFLGGTVHPGGAQVAGTYTGTITLNVVYTGL